MPARTPHKLRLILTTTGSEEQALAIARALVSDRLAACVNIIGPIRSVYRWRDAIEDEREYLLLIKTRALNYMKVERRVRELHTYEVPEVLALTVDRGSPPYIQWLLDSTRAQAISAEASDGKLKKNRPARR
jgi:periplasmic divalent cation tolerance protein